MPAIVRGVPRRAFIGTYSALLKSNVRGRGKSFAASVPSGSYKPQKGQKKSKEERRAMIESFVDKYRASNAGKFPTASHIRQEVGGSFYTVREIIQELQYNHKMSLLNKIEVVQPGKLEKVIDPSSVSKGHFFSNEEKILASTTTTKVRSKMKHIDKIMSDESLLLKNEANMHLEVNGEKAKPSVEEPVSPAVMAVDHSSEKVVNLSGHRRVSRPRIDKVHGKGIPSGVVKERLQDNAQFSNRDRKSDASISSIASEQVVSSSKPSDKEDHFDASSVSLKTESKIDISQSASGQIDSNTADVNATKLSQGMDSLNGVEHVGNHETSKTEELHRERLIGSAHGESSPKTASFWENLRSLRDGIINFWKKM